MASAIFPKHIHQCEVIKAGHKKMCSPCGCVCLVSHSCSKAMSAIARGGHQIYRSVWRCTSWNYSLGFSTFQFLPDADITQSTKAGAHWSTLVSRGMKLSMHCPLITPLFRSPQEIPSIPFSIILIPATQIRWIMRSPRISNFCKRRIRSKRPLLLEDPLKYARSMMKLLVNRNHSVPRGMHRSVCYSSFHSQHLVTELSPV
jgi:hypothetical protein